MRASLVVAVCFVVGCGGQSSNDSNPVPTVASTSDNVCEQIADVACYDMYLCCSNGEIQRLLGITDPEPIDQCKTDVVKLCDRKLTGLTFSLANNRVTFDSAIMDTCLKALIAPDGTCGTVDTSLPWTAACKMSAWVGAVADGGQCKFDYECATDSYCTPGEICKARPGLGQPCDTGCASGLYCNLGMCAQQIGVDGPCTATSQCAKDLYCDTGIVPSACKALHGPGEVCDGAASCKSGPCLPGTCMGSTQACYTSANCTKRCSQNPVMACAMDGDCGAGHCSITTTQSCTFPTDCTVAQGTCLYPNKCNPVTCTGNVVCDAPEVTVDYCTNALLDIPIL
jgi:hypothetical protein